MKELRLILGCARSGTSWIHTVLSKTSTPIRSLKEPITTLSNMVEILPAETSLFKNRENLLCFDTSPMDSSHLLRRAYAYCLEGDLKNNKRVLRRDAYYDVCLVKEIHGLLAALSLINTFNAKAVLILRHPIYIVDSLLSIRDDLHHFKTPEDELGFQIDIYDHVYKSERERVILIKLLAIMFIHNFFEYFALSNKIMLVNYETVCSQPYMMFERMASFLDLEWGEDQKRFLTETTTITKKGPYTIHRKRYTQLGRSFRFLNDRDLSLCRKVLNRGFSEYVKRDSTF